MLRLNTYEAKTNAMTRSGSKLGHLFRAGPKVGSMITKLWQKRSKAIHKGEVFEHALLPNSYPLQALTNGIHYLFSGTIAFAFVDAGTVEELWTRASPLIFQIGSLSQTQATLIASQSLFGLRIRRRFGQHGPGDGSVFPLASERARNFP
jgi:ABC-type uncharacterized transport system permease subunit